MSTGHIRATLSTVPVSELKNPEYKVSSTFLLKRKKSTYKNMCVTADGLLVGLTALDEKGLQHINFWDIEKQQKIASHVVPKGLVAMTPASKEGVLLGVIANSGAEKMSDLYQATVTQVAKINTFPGEVSSLLAVGDDLLACNLKNRSQVQIRRTREKSSQFILEKTGIALEMCLTDDGRLLTSSAVDDKLQLWNLRTGKRDIEFEWDLNCAAVTLPGKRIAAALADRILIGQLKGTSLDSTFIPTPSSPMISHLLALPDGNLACGRLDGSLQIWDPITKQCLFTHSLVSEPKNILGMALTKDHRLVCQMGDGNLIIIDVGMKQRLTRQTALEEAKTALNTIFAKVDKALIEKEWELVDEEQIVSPSALLQP